MRLLHVCRTLNPEFGGPPDSVRMFCAEHIRAGNEVEVTSLDDPAAEFSQIDGAQVHAFGPCRANYFYEPRLQPWLEENCRRFDGVIVNGIWQYHSVAARRAIAGKVPYVVFSHGMLDPYFNRRYPLKYLKKLAYWSLYEHQTLNRARAVCFTSDEEMRVAAAGLPFRNFNGVVIPYGTMGPPPGEQEPMRREFLAAFPQLAGKPYLLYLSRIHPKKGCDLLLEAFARVTKPEIQLVMAGPDTEGWGETLKGQAERLGIADRVHWTGMLRGPVKWGAFYGAEAFVLPSHQENFGIAVADALACGVIPLITDKVNIAPDVAGDESCLMEPDTLDGVTRLLERFQAMTPTERATMSVNGIQCFQRRYALSNSAEAVYRALGLSDAEPNMNPAGEKL